MNETSRLLNSYLPDKILLHIGMTKAGSTAIQNIFFKNYDHVLDKGILFPKSVFSNNVNPYYKHGTPGHLPLINLIKRNESIVLSEFRENQSKVDRVFLSCENIFLDLREGELDILAELLKGKEVTVVILLRNQLEWLPSIYYQSVVRGHRKEQRSLGEFVDSLLVENKLNYFERLRYIGEKFSASRITALDYNEVKRSGGSITAILKELGLDALPSSVTKAESNVSFTYPERIEAHRRINVIAGELPRELYLAWCGDMEAMVTEVKYRQHMGRGHVKVQGELRKRVLEACRESNRKLSATYFGGKPFGPVSDFMIVEDGVSPLNEALVSELIKRGLALLVPYLYQAHESDLKYSIKSVNYQEMRQKMAALKREHSADLEEARQRMADLKRDYEAICVYTNQLEQKCKHVLRSRSWRMLAPFRFIARQVRGVFLGRRCSPLQLPERPDFARPATGKKAGKNDDAKSVG